MRAWIWAALLAVLVGIAMWLWWPSKNAPVVVPADAGARGSAVNGAVLTQDPTATGAEWSRAIAGGPVVDLGDLAITAKHGRPYGFDVGLGDQVLSIDGRDVSSLGRESVGGLLETTAQGVSVLIKRESGETVTKLAPAPPPKPHVDD